MSGWGNVKSGKCRSGNCPVADVSVGEVSEYRFKRVCCVEWPFLKPHNFGDNIFSENFSICSKRTLSNIFEIIGNKLTGR